MSPVNQLTILALASTVFAVPHVGHGHGHAHAHRHLSSYGAPSYGAPSYGAPSHKAPSYGASAPAPYPYAHGNGTSVGPTGTGYPYGKPSSIPGYSSPIPGYSSSIPGYEGSGTLTSTQYETITHTINYAPSSAAGYGYGSGDQCAQEVTVTSTAKVYVTVTAGQAPSYSESSPVESSYVRPTSTIHITKTHTLGSYGSSSVPVYSAPSSSSSVASYATSSSPEYTTSSSPEYSASSPSSVASYATSSSAEYPTSYSTSSTPTYALPVLSTYSAVAKEVGLSSTSSAPAASSSSPSSSSGGKRGLAYNAADLTTCFDGSEEISWAYNWVSASAGLTGNLSYIPTLHDGSAVFTDVWNAEASAAISSGSTTLFSFNEPDQVGQANMSPEAAAAAYKQFMVPFAGKAKLCAPSVTNAQNNPAMGLAWLQSFLEACGDESECPIDYYNIHWYSPYDVDAFKQQVTDAIAIEPKKPIYISEFGLTGASDDQVTSFLEEVMPWLDSNDSVLGYAYYYVADGELLAGDAPSTYGKTYMSYTA